MDDIVKGSIWSAKQDGLVSVVITRVEKYDHNPDYRPDDMVYNHPVGVPEDERWFRNWYLKEHYKLAFTPEPESEIKVGSIWQEKAYKDSKITIYRVTQTKIYYDSGVGLRYMNVSRKRFLEAYEPVNIHCLDRIQEIIDADPVEQNLKLTKDADGTVRATFNITKADYNKIMGK